MITSTPSRLFGSWILPILSWINSSSASILFGLYHGFLIALPLSLSQLLAIRAFLLGGNLGGIIAVSGSIIGQSMILLSIHYSPLYRILTKPHAFTLFVLPYTFFYWYRTKDLSDYRSLRSIASLQDTRIYELLFDSITFQLLNPILLPSPVLARSLNPLLFRYSGNISFLISTISGWFFGQYLFIGLGRLLLLRIESDSPILYLLVKRIIHRTFSIIVFSFSLLHLGRTPVPFVTKRIIDDLRFAAPKRDEFSRSQKLWPGLFFNYRQWKRPLRYIGNSRFSAQSPVKKKVSQYFFDVCLSDGKHRLSFTYLPSLAILEKNLGEYFNRLELSSSDESFRKWISIKKNKKECVFNEFQQRVESLDTGFSLGEVIEKRTGLSNSEGKILNKFCDPLLSRRSDEMVSKSPRLLTEEFNGSGKKHKPQFFSTKKNKLKDWISNQWQGLEYKGFVLPWEPLTRDARRILGLFMSESKKVGFDTNSKRVYLLDGDAAMDSNEKNDLPIDNTRKKLNRKSNLNWELVSNLSPRQRLLYLDHIQTDERDPLRNAWKKLFVDNTTRAGNINTTSFSAEASGIGRELRELSKEVPRWTSDLRNDKFDVIAIGVTDIRQRRVKNLGYLIKGKDKRRKIVRRFSQQSDFRRKLVKGAMRARRRKTLVWEMFQLGTNSPFFLRLSEKPTPIFRTFTSEKNIFKTSQNTSGRDGRGFSNHKILSIEKTRADRLSIANRWDFPLAQWGRSWLLIIQSHFRKYVVLPILVILKNVSRLLLFLDPEWNEDWVEWNKEIHIRCTYDGTEVSEKELPEQWLRDGLQIKVIYPFHLRPWHNSRYRNKNLKINEKYLEGFVGREKLNYCYLTAWGFLTDLPFGNTKKQPSFWKPINVELKKRWGKKVSLGFLSVGKESSRTVDVTGLERFETRISESLESSDWYGSDLEVKYRRIDEKSNNFGKSSVMINENFVPGVPERFHVTSIHIQELKNSVAEKNGKKASNHYWDANLRLKEERLESAKEIIRIERIITRSCRKNIESAKKLFSLSNVSIERIGTNFRVRMEILKESIENLFNGDN
uniref:hypothetical chloroplast RF19 n=1 Tax=Moerckia flotoviana TaxID=71401 RepID=UPI00257A2C6E|nr:hypothetical chloroplast RF19 [Moerckia flotoviana]WIA67354.1 hypothetical chloroplast RF19 [Moerckia flotoviana]